MKTKLFTLICAAGLLMGCKEKNSYNNDTTAPTGVERSTRSSDTNKNSSTPATPNNNGSSTSPSPGQPAPSTPPQK